MDDACGGEAFSETDVKVFFDTFAGGVPWEFAVCVGEYVWEGGLGGLEGHGHAVSREGWDDRVGVAEGEDAGVGCLEAEFEACDCGEGVWFPFGVLQGFSEVEVSIFPEVGREEILMTGGDGAVDFE